MPTAVNSAPRLPERQRTLRGTIDWSHGLLEPAEQQLFARLAVFAGGWSRDAAEAICADDLRIDVLNGLESLLDKSLVSRMTGEGEAIRFAMLETIREYALERLEASGEAALVRNLHAGFYRAIAESAEPHLTGPESTEWLARLTAEVPAGMIWGPRWLRLRRPAAVRDPDGNLIGLGRDAPSRG
jgi:predicted ATPase